ncbi:MAG: hypothetical protein KBB32_00310 [Spirochaetia bacterium]|nr:hypothetical protein [Spirochaetia bacterium]
MVRAQGGGRATSARVAALVAAALAAACGIDIVSYLSQQPVSDGPNLVKAPAAPDSMYLGVELFYRIYATYDDAQSDLTAYSAKQSSETIPGESVESFLLSQSNYAYRTLVVDGLDPGPTLRASLLAFDLATLAFSSTTESTITIGANPPYDLSRNLPTPVSFSVPPTEGDQDYEHNDDDPDTGIFYIHTFAACYGLDTANSTFPNLYSKAVSLGITTLSYD